MFPSPSSGTIDAFETFWFSDEFTFDAGRTRHERHVGRGRGGEKLF
ncbi:MAG: hypothetical protein ACJAR2_001284 [Ilumatobacter sp.]|jgi:hypothetical protein